MDRNIQEFLYSASLRMARRNYLKTAEEIDRSGIASPLEQRLFIALKTTIHILETPLAEEEDGETTSNHWEYKDNSFVSNFFRITPQVEIRPYVVDFVLRARCRDRSRYIVECDSWEFHERTPQDQAYEKKRDRFLQCQGYLVLHYTGREIRNDPYCVATDILARAMRPVQGLSDETKISDTQKNLIELVTWCRDVPLLG